MAMAALLALSHFRELTAGRNPQTEAMEPNQAVPQPNLARRSKSDAFSAVATPPMPNPASNYAGFSEWRHRQMEAGWERFQDQWRTPIEFYGKVVDEITNPVADADVRFVWTDLSPDGSSEKQTLSDANGLFSLTGVTGKNLIVQVSKQGYYAYVPSGLSFSYAGQPQNFIPDSGNPVLFRLKKKGVAQPLVRFKKPFSVPKDGSPIRVDLATGTLTASADASLEVQCWTQDGEKKAGWQFDWKCRISVTGGGVQSCVEDFPFLAPVSGYLSSDEIDVAVRKDQEWHPDVERRYFVRTADGRFGRIVFRMVAHGDHFCLIESYFNPSGSRNLEYDPNYVINQQ